MVTFGQHNRTLKEFKLCLAWQWPSCSYAERKAVGLICSCSDLPMGMECKNANVLMFRVMLTLFVPSTSWIRSHILNENGQQGGSAGRERYSFSSNAMYGFSFICVLSHTFCRWQHTVTVIVEAEAK